MRRKTLGFTAASLAALGAFAVAGAAIASAADDGAGAPGPSASASGAPTAPGQGHTDGKGGPGGASQDTAVTGDEADEVIAAVKAEDSAATIDTVRKDPDGSYDALGTKDGSPVMYDVSADLATVTEHAGGGPGGLPGGRGGPGGTTNDGSSSDSGTTSADPSDADDTAFRV